MRRRIASSFAVLGLLSAVSMVSAADQPGPNPAAQEYRAKQVLGAKVSLDGGSAAGTVDDIVFDDSGSIEYLLVINKGKLVTVPWDAATFNPQQQTAVIKITPKQYGPAQTYTAEKYPAFSAPLIELRPTIITVLTRDKSAVSNAGPIETNRT